MNRSERRRLDKEIKKLTTNTDACTLCGRDFPHNSKTFYGADVSGRAAIAGECCQARLPTMIGMGIYATGDYDVFRAGQRASEKQMPPGRIESVVGDIQKVIGAADDLSAGMLDRAGLPAGRSSINILSSPWKTADAGWFEANPDRSHRLRPMFPGEADTLPPDLRSTKLPPRHELQVIVRQIEPGKRIRMPFGRNVDTPIPDVEAVLHALFDSVANGRPGIEIKVADVASRARPYLNPSRQS